MGLRESNRPKHIGTGFEAGIIRVVVLGPGGALRRLACSCHLIEIKASRSVFRIMASMNKTEFFRCQPRSL